MSLNVMIPTLNEEKNIDLLLERLTEVRRTEDIEFDILFVDSASQDKTCEKISAWSVIESVRLIEGKVNLGLAGAVMVGAEQCISTHIIVMDCDLSHPPEKIPELIKPVEDGICDMTIGSRYVKGGAMVDWPLSRKISSRLATMPAQIFCDAKDPLSGFFAVRRELVTGLPRAVPGFKIGLAILAQYRTSLRVKEIPIEFRDRDCGDSKMGKRVAFDYLRQLAGLAMTWKSK